jgi:hypothetical protein
MLHVRDMSHGSPLPSELLAAVATHLPWRDVVYGMGRVNWTLRRALLDNAPMFNRDWPPLQPKGDAYPEWPVRRLTVRNDTECAAADTAVGVLDDVEEAVVVVVIDGPWPLPSLPNLTTATIRLGGGLVFLDDSTWSISAATYPSATTLVIVRSCPSWDWIAETFPRLVSLVVRGATVAMASSVPLEHLTTLTLKHCATTRQSWSYLAAASLLTSLRTSTEGFSMLADDHGDAFPLLRHLELDSSGGYGSGLVVDHDSFPSAVRRFVGAHPHLETARLELPGRVVNLDVIVAFLGCRTVQRAEAVCRGLRGGVDDLFGFGCHMVQDEKLATFVFQRGYDNNIG